MTVSKLYDTIIVGGGPVGLFLANELALAKLSVLVLEREPNANSPWKTFPLGMRGLNPSSLEHMQRRGLLDKLMATSPAMSIVRKTKKTGFMGHFAGIPIMADNFDLTRWKYRLPGPTMRMHGTTTDKVDALLSEEGVANGATIMRDQQVTSISEAEDGKTVSITTQHGAAFKCRWLIGCDGGRSTVRKTTGFEFNGTEPQYTGYSISCTFEDDKGIDVGFKKTNGGFYAAMEPNALHLIDFDTVGFDRTQTPSKEFVQQVLTRITERDDLIIKDLKHVFSSTDRCRQASTYRKGRVLLAGDAAHIHSPLGAQGLNMGLGDAINLGWKLAAIIRQEQANTDGKIDLTLLDTYETERHPIAAWCLEWTRAQIATLLPDLYASSIRTLVTDLMATKDGTNLLVDKIWGLSRQYDLGGSHELVGMSMPELELENGDRLGSRLAQAKGLMVVLQANDNYEKILQPYGQKVDLLNIKVKESCGLAAFAVRPDGIVCWATDETEAADMTALQSCLQRWFSY